MRSKAIHARQNWPFVVTLVFLLGATAFIGRMLHAGEPAKADGDARVQSSDVVVSNSAEDVPMGVGQPLDFYKRYFGPRDTSIGHACACFAPGTDERVVAYVSEQEQIDPVERYQLGGRWSGAQGTPRALTWSFVPDGLSISGGVGEPTANSELFSRMDTLFAAQGGRATWINRVQQSFDRWAQLCAVTYTRVTFGGNDWDDGAAWGSGGSAGLRGDIRISMHLIDGTNGILAYTYFPSNGDMVFDMGENWALSSNAHRFFRNTFMHEHGHGLGLGHVCPVNVTKLMEPFLATSFDGLRHDDIRAGQRHYGDIYENNNTAGTATNLGTLAPGTPIDLGALPNPVSGTSPANSSTLSIDANGKSDYYKFHVDGAVYATVSVTPKGFTYLNGPQNGDGSCSAGTSFNSLAVADLVLTLIDTDGSTVLFTSNGTGAGSAETITNFLLSAAGDYYINVSENNVPTESQLYTLSLSAIPGCSTINVDPPTLPGAVIGQFYNEALSASGGTGPYTFSLIFGSLPPELTLSPAGVISGTPVNSIGTFNITVQATDSGNCTGVRAYPFIVSCGLLGDVNNDSSVDGLDIQGYTDCVLGGGSSPGDYCGCADMNANGTVTHPADTQLFIDALVP